MSSTSFTHESKLLLKLSGPIIIGQVGQVVIGLADTVMVGALGPVSLGASAFGNSVFAIFFVFGLGLLSPLSALFAHSEGEENYPHGGKLLHHGLAVAFGISLVMILILYASLPLLPHLGQTPEILKTGTAFFKIIMWSIVPSMIYQAYKQFTDGIGRTKIGMVVMLVGVIVNVPANYILIHGLYGFPRMGLNGSATATLLVRILMAMALAIYVHLHPQFHRYMTEKWTHRFDHYVLKNVLRLGIPNGFTFLFEVAGFSAAAILMGRFGAVPLAAHQITISLASTTFMVTVGLGIAASIRVGYERGRKQWHLARYIGFTAIALGAAYMSVCALMMYALRFWFPSLYVNDKEVIAWTAKFLVIVAFFEIFDGAQAVAIGALRGMADTKWPSVFAFVSYWILGLPLGYMMSFHWGLGPIGIWLGLLIGLMIAASLMTWRFHRLTRVSFIEG